MKFKISLRALIALFVAASLPLAWLANYRRTVLREYEHAAILESYGDTVTWRSSLRKLAWYETDHIAKVVCADRLERMIEERRYVQSLDEPTLAALESLTGLESLDLSRSLVTDGDLRRAARCPAIVSCNLAWTRLTDRGVQHLERLPNLAELDLTGTSISEATLCWLGRSGVTRLNLTKCRRVRSLYDLTKSRALVELDLTGMPIQDGNLRALRQIVSLRRLSVCHTRVSRTGIQELGQWGHLQWFEYSDVCGCHQPERDSEVCVEICTCRDSPYDEYHLLSTSDPYLNSSRLGEWVQTPD